MFFKCAHRAPAADHGAGQHVSNGSKTLIVDIHCHCSIAAAGEQMKQAEKDAGRQPLAYGGGLTSEINARQLQDIHPKMNSLDERLADMDKMGVDVQAISVPPYQYFYWADAEKGREITYLINNSLAEVAAKNPDRIVALGTLPMQNTEMAVAEMERCINELGMRGVAISTNVNGEELSNPRLEPFFAKAEELGILIFVHPEGFTHAERMKNHYFINLIGHPLESTLAISYLIFDGVLDRHPGLKICFAHGGGFLPGYAGRMDHGYHARADCRQGIPDNPPGHYMKMLYFDTMVFEPDQLTHMVQRYGADHVLLGTDYPYDMGETDPLGLIGRVDLSDDDRAAMSGLTAAKLLKIPH